MAFEVIGHRGAAGHAPENTAASFQLALALNVDAIELDVQLSQDGVPVVIHDETLDRTTDGSGPVDTVPFEKLKGLDAGSWFHPRYQGERLLSLAEALSIISGRVPVVIELKGTTRVRELTEKTGEALQGYPAGNSRVILSSFTRSSLEVAKDLAPEIPRAWLIPAQESDVDEVLRIAEHLELYQLCPFAVGLSQQIVERMHQEGYNVRTWGVPRTLPEMLATMRAIVSLGVDGSTADFPDLLRTTVLAHSLLR